MTDARPPLPSATVPRTVLDLGDGTRWVALDTPEASYMADCLARVRVGLWLPDDLARGDVGASHYALVEGGPEPVAVHVVARLEAGPAEDGMDLIVGQGGVDPHPRHGAAIAALGAHLGRDLSPGGPGVHEDDPDHGDPEDDLFPGP